MARSTALSALSRIRDAAALCEHTGMPAKEALQQLDAARMRRRRFGRLAATAGGAVLAPLGLRTALAQASPDVAVVGAGLAGLYAATVLATKRIPTQVYDADGRVGGRVASLRRVFPGQVAELGAELIDTTHVTLRGLVTAFGLRLEDYAKQPGAVTYRFFGRTYADAAVVEEYRAFTAAMNADLQRLSAGPTADGFNEFDRILDHLPLSDYLASRGAGALLRSVIDVAYTIEFGRPIDRQSCLSLLFFAQASRRSRFTPFGVFSDERFHVVEGNDAVPTAMAAALPRPVQFGHRLLRVSASQSGALTLAFDVGGRIVERVHRAAVLALPAPLMRQVEFDASVDLPESARRAIAGIDYGANSKMMIGFRGRPWYELHASNGSSYSDLPNHQSTWETNPSAARYGDRGVLTDYSGGVRAAALDARRTQREAEAFLSDLDQVWPGAAAYASRDRSGRILAHLTNWSQAPLFQGGYTNNQPGYFTTLEGLYARPARANLVFAGEHTDSFYSYQGFMEGALLSGARAADQIWRATR